MASKDEFMSRWPRRGSTKRPASERVTRSISARCTIFSSNDDYSGDTMTNPTVPDRYRGTVDARVVVNSHVILGAGTTVLVWVTLGESAAVGAMSLVKEDVAAFTIVAGVPARLCGRA